MEIYVDHEAKLTLHGLVQHYVMLREGEKNRKLNDLLDALDFNQVVIFVRSVARAKELDRLLRECNFPSTCIHRGMKQDERLAVYKVREAGGKVEKGRKERKKKKGERKTPLTGEKFATSPKPKKNDRPSRRARSASWSRPTSSAAASTSSASTS